MAPQRAITGRYLQTRDKCVNISFQKLPRFTRGLSFKVSGDVTLQAPSVTKRANFTCFKMRGDWPEVNPLNLVVGKLFLPPLHAVERVRITLKQSSALQKLTLIGRNQCNLFTKFLSVNLRKISLAGHKIDRTPSSVLNHAKIRKRVIEREFFVQIYLFLQQPF